MADYLKQSLLTGLTSSPKYIPTWYNYDDVGSKLQHDSCEINQNYYLSRNQISVLENSVQDIIPRVSYDLTLVDLGSGNCSKTRFVINELLKRQKMLTFYPVDISGEFLKKAAKTLSEEYDDSLVVQPIAADYVQGIKQLKQVKGAKMIIWFGSMINLSYDDQVNTIRMISTMMTDKCRLVFSADITQDREAILKAYNNGITRVSVDHINVVDFRKTNIIYMVKETLCAIRLTQRFHQYAITRLNREEASAIDLAKFTHTNDYVSNNNPQYMSYVTSYILAKEDIRYYIPGLNTALVMEKGERLYFHEGAGLSCKYTLEQLRNIVQKAGLRLLDTWTDKGQHAVFCQCTTI